MFKEIYENKTARIVFIVFWIIASIVGFATLIIGKWPGFIKIIAMILIGGIYSLLLVYIPTIIYYGIRKLMKK